MGNYRLGMEMNEGYGTYLAHYGIKGQKWGVRRFQNPDGTLTEEGKKRYLNSSTGKQNAKKLADVYKKYVENRLFEKRKLPYSDLAPLEQLMDEASKLSGIDDAYNVTGRALENKNNNKNPFKAKQLNKNLENAKEKERIAWDNYGNMFADMTMDYVETLPANKREEAMAFAARWILNVGGVHLN